MTKGLKTLQKLREMELDGLRRELAVFYQEVDAIEAKERELSQQLVDEQIYLTRLEGMTSYAMFAQSAREWQNTLAQQKVEVEAKITSKMMQISAAFEALKTVQIAQEKADMSHAAKRDKAEQDAADEAALTQYARQNAHS
ncbi:MAG: hypothetical protein AAF337_14910 [Pseudomonadota bacterium]